MRVTGASVCHGSLRHQDASPMRAGRQRVTVASGEPAQEASNGKTQLATKGGAAVIKEITPRIKDSKALAPNANHHPVDAVSFSWKATS